MDPSPSELVHVWHSCHHCGAEPIVGTRFHCETCPVGPDNDLCARCHALHQTGQVEHPAEGSLAAGMATGTGHRFSVSEGKPRHRYDTWLTVAHRPAASPEVPDHFVVRPEFCAGLETIFGGYSFVAAVEGYDRPLLLTALHVMDEMIKEKGLDCTRENERYTGRELPAILTKVTLYDVFAANWVFADLGSAGPMLVLPDTRTNDDEPDSHRDVAAFRIADPTGLSPVELAPRAPEVGEPIWLVARMPGRRTARSVVVEVTETSLVFRYEDTADLPRFTSGAPLLNADREVVGINVGKGKLDGQAVGHANHVLNIRRHLRESIELSR